MEQAAATARGEGSPGAVAGEGADVPQARGRAEPTDRQPVGAVEPVAAGPDPQASVGAEPQRAKAEVARQPEGQRPARPGSIRLPLEARDVAGHHPQSVAARGLDCGHLLLEGRPNVQSLEPAVDESADPPVQAEPQAPSRSGSQDDHRLGQGHGLSRHPPAHLHEPRAPGRPHVPVLVQRQVLARPGTPRAEHGLPRARAVRLPDPPVRRLAERATGRIEHEREGVDPDERRRDDESAPSACDAPEVALLGEEHERVPSGRRQGHDAVRREPRVGGHVEDVEAEAVEAGEPPECRQPELTAGQQDDVGDGVLGKALRGRPLDDAVFATDAVARRGDESGLGPGEGGAEGEPGDDGPHEGGAGPHDGAYSSRPGPACTGGLGVRQP